MSEIKNLLESKGYDVLCWNEEDKSQDIYRVAPKQFTLPNDVYIIVDGDPSDLELYWGYKLNAVSRITVIFRDTTIGARKLAHFFDLSSEEIVDKFTDISDNGEENIDFFSNIQIRVFKVINRIFSNNIHITLENIKNSSTISRYFKDDGSYDYSVLIKLISEFDFKVYIKIFHTEGDGYYYVMSVLCNKLLVCPDGFQEFKVSQDYYRYFSSDITHLPSIETDTLEDMIQFSILEVLTKLPMYSVNLSDTCYGIISEINNDRS